VTTASLVRPRDLVVELLLRRELLYPVTARPAVVLHMAESMDPRSLLTEHE
jgi:hypothetical protein